MTPALAVGKAAPGPNPQQLSLFPGGDLPRLALLCPYDYQLIVDQLVGVAARVLAPIKSVPACTIHVLGVMLQRAGGHSNRVWPSFECIQKDLATERGVSAGIRTIERAVHYLREHLHIDIIRDRIALYAGPGPHAYPSENKRVGDREVPTWEMSSLLKFLPETLMRLFGMERAYEQQKAEEEAAAEEAALLASSSPPHPIPKQTLHRPSIPDPVPNRSANPTDPLCYVGIEIKSEDAQKRTRTAPKGRDFVTPDLADRNIEAEKGDPGMKNAQKLTPEQTAMAEKLVASIPGLEPWWAKGWVRRYDIEWCEKLLLYGKECGIKDGATKGGGWYTNTVAEWDKGQGEWPIWFLHRLKVEETSRELAAEASAVARAATPLVQAPDPVQPRKTIAASTADLDALPADRREALLDRAVGELLAQHTSGLSPLRITIKRSGHKSQWVRARAAQLLAAEEATAASTAPDGGRGP